MGTGSFQSCASANAQDCSFKTSDGSTFACASCADCADAMASVAAWCSPGGSLAPPTGLIVTAANKSEIDLSWTASPAAGVTYALQRQPVDGAAATIAQGLTTLTYADRTIDPDTDYTYAVQAASPAGASTLATTVHAVGPPPAGFALVAPPPAGADAARFGTDISWTSDANGDPALAYIARDPNGDGVETDGGPFFVGWSRKGFSWNAPVQVDASGLLGDSGHGTSIATDAVSGTLVLAYVGTPSQGASSGLLTVSIATSTDEGVTWTKRGAVPTGFDTDEPSLAVAAGTAHLACYVSSDNDQGSRVQYATGAMTTPTAWTFAEAPLVDPNGVAGAETPLTMALDAAGAAALAYWVNTTDARANTSGYSLAFWRPDEGVAGGVVVTPAEGVPGELDVALAFFGTAPRIAFLDDAFDPAGLHNLWTSKSADGTVFAAPVAVANDGDASLDLQIGLALDIQGHGAIVAESNHNGTSSMCGNPKLARSTDFAAWAATCSPDPTAAQKISGGLTGYDVIRFGGNGKLDVAGNNHEGNGGGAGLADGVFFWHEP